MADIKLSNHAHSRDFDDLSLVQRKSPLNMRNAAAHPSDGVASIILRVVKLFGIFELLILFGTLDGIASESVASHVTRQHLHTSHGETVLRQGFTNREHICLLQDTGDVHSDTEFLLTWLNHENGWGPQLVGVEFSTFKTPQLRHKACSELTQAELDDTPIRIKFFLTTGQPEGITGFIGGGSSYSGTHPNNLVDLRYFLIDYVFSTNQAFRDANVNLINHEMGHALGLDDPGSPSQPPLTRCNNDPWNGLSVMHVTVYGCRAPDYLLPTPSDLNTVRSLIALGADLEITSLEYYPEEPIEGLNSVEYVAHVRNNGQSAAPNSVVESTITLPSGGIRSGRWGGSNQCAVDSIRVICFLGTLARNQSQEVRILVTGPNRGDIFGAITTRTSDVDYVPWNHFRSGSVSVGAEADLSVTLRHIHNPINISDPLDYATYEIMVTNGGPSRATNVVVRDPLPSSMIPYSAVSNTQTNVCTIVQQLVTCTFGTLANGEARSARIQARPQSVRTVVNRAFVANSEIDSDTDDRQGGPHQMSVVSCSPRPRVGIVVSRHGDGRLRAVITPGIAPPSTSANALRGRQETTSRFRSGDLDGWSGDG